MVAIDDPSTGRADCLAPTQRNNGLDTGPGHRPKRRIRRGEPRSLTFCRSKTIPLTRPRPYRPLTMSRPYRVQGKIGPFVMKQSKSKRRSIRLPGWDYRNAGFYFVTICTHQRTCLFDDPKLHEIAANAWLYIPQQPHAQHVALDEWVVMPNHIHGLIEIVISPEPDSSQTHQVPQLQSGSLGAIVGNYKMLVSKRVKAMQRMMGTGHKVWQRGYWERIVRNERELNAIRQYIKNNPLRWNEDRDNLDQTLNRMKYIP